MPSGFSEIAMTTETVKMSKITRNVPLFVLGLVFLWGCGRTDGSHVGSPALRQACSSYTDIYRQREANCYGVASAPDMSTVKARQTETCVLYSSAPGSATDATYWNACTTAANNNCRAYKCVRPPGARQAGQPCLASHQCASLACQGTQVLDAYGAVLPNGIQCGTCAVQLPEGSPCNSSTDICDVDMSCFQGTCRRQGQAGAPCKSWNDCAWPQLVCRSSGICGEAAYAGQTCAGNTDCTTDQGCDPSTKVCVPLRFGQPGQACDDIVNLCESGACNRLSRTCPTVLPDGAACDPNSGSEVCQIYAHCFLGVCQIPDPAECG
jgi:hypothetical protein